MPEHLGASIALNERHLAYTILVSGDKGLHSGTGVAARNPGNICCPQPGLLIQSSWHELCDVLVTKANLNHLLEARVEPHKPSTSGAIYTIHLQLQLEETAISFLVHLGRSRRGWKRWLLEQRKTQACA